MVLDGCLDASREAAATVIDEVDAAYSRFRLDSEIAAVNRSAGTTTRVSPLLGRAIRGALNASRWTNGAVDPTVGGALRAIGYDRDFALLGDATPQIELRIERVPGYATVTYHDADGRLRLRPGTELDLGSTGKGLAADLTIAAALSAARPDAGVLVSLGGDIAAGGRAPDGGWQVRIADDSATRTGGADEVISIWNGAVATSSTSVRRWTTVGGLSVHHIVDPRTALPAVTPWRTASVVAATCEIANGASTAAIVLGEAAPDWLNATGLPARLVSTDGEVVRIGPWPAPPSRPPARAAQAMTDV